jgi:hypothetical protein
MPDELEKMRALNPKSLKELKEETEFERFLQGDESEATTSTHH